MNLLIVIGFVSSFLIMIFYIRPHMKKATSKEEKVEFVKDFLLDRFGIGALFNVSIIMLIFGIYIG